MENCNSMFLFDKKRTVIHCKSINLTVVNLRTDKYVWFN